MKSNDPREIFLTSIALDKSRVNLDPPIVFLFGGKLSNSEENVRSILHQYIKQNQESLFESIVMPDDFQDWLHDSNYPDLLTFESDLAQTSSLIIIALESPGSIAELGAFSVNVKLKNKINLILCEHHKDQKSFITQGPLRQIPDSNIYSYNYDRNSVKSTFDVNFLQDLVENIQCFLSGTKKTEEFDISNNGHIAFLIYDLLLIFKALNITEICSYLDRLNCNREPKEIKRLLYLLQKLSLIKISRYGNVNFYLTIKPYPRIDFVSNGKTLDRASFSMKVSQYYLTSKKETKRINALKQIREGK